MWLTTLPTVGLLGLHGVLVYLFDSHMLPIGWVHMAVITGLNFMVLGFAALGGRMEVESELGQGSTFRVFLPCH